MKSVKQKFAAVATSLALIVVVAAGLRLGFAWNQVRKIPSAALAVVPFQQETGNIAYSLSQGHGFSALFRQNTGPTAWLTPVYPLVLAAIFKIFGPFTQRAFFVAAGLNIVFSSAACVPIFYAGRRVAGSEVASAAAWLWAFFPNAILIPFEWIWDTSLSALLAALILCVTLALPQSKLPRDWSAYGLLWGFALLTNPALAALLPFLLGWAAYRSPRPNAQQLKRAALSFAVILACCAPWTVRNYLVFHTFIPLRSNFAFELWLGNNEIFDDTAANPRARVTQYEETRRYAQIGETSFMQEKWDKATQFIASHPRLELHLLARRFVATWMGLASPLRAFVESDSWFARTALLANAAVAVGTLAGIVILFVVRNPYAFPLAAFPLIFPVTYYIAHTSLRHRHPIDPVLILLLAVSLFAPRQFHISCRFHES